VTRVHRSAPAAAGAALFLLLNAATARAQSTAQIPLHFDFMNPGARSLGLGGAFIGAADDATAAFANPSGLAFLTRREISAEGRFRSIETPFLAGGRLSGTPTGTDLDTAANAVYGRDVDREFGPAFLSLILPLGRVTIAAYRHEVVTIENTFFSQGTFERTSVPGAPETTGRDPALGGTRTIRIRNYGGAVGYKITDRLAVGGGVSAYTFSLESDFARFPFLTDTSSAVDTSKSIATATQRGDDVSLGGNVGVLWVAGPRVKVGATFRRGPAFTFTQRDFSSISGVEVNRTGRFRVPDVWGAGIEWRVSDNVRVLGDYDRVQYAQLKHDFIDFQAISSGREGQLRIDNGNELHAGIERLFLNAPKPIALRVGAWFDPDHAVRYIPTPQNDVLDIRLAATLPGGSNLVHYTFGGGLAFSSWLELNAAADVSSKTTYVTASAVVRF
jgi:long-chain fatty acid transport protein